jgi:hypothetical protein
MKLNLNLGMMVMSVILGLIGFGSAIANMVDLG